MILFTTKEGWTIFTGVAEPVDEASEVDADAFVKAPKSAPA